MVLGNKISEGGCADIHEWGEGKIVKLAKANTNDYAMKREYDNSKTAYEADLPTVKTYELLSLSGRTGIVFDKFSGETLKDIFFKDLVTGKQDGSLQEDLFRLSARALHQIHSLTDVKVSYKQHDFLEYGIRNSTYLTDDEKDRICKLLYAYPDQAVFCHGDPNPGNIMLGEDGQYVIIDWMDASLGNPAADLAEFIVMIRRTVLPEFLPEQARQLFDSLRERIVEIFMEEYTSLSGITYEEVVPWFVPISARKLSADAITEAEKQLLVQDIRHALRDME